MVRNAIKESVVQFDLISDSYNYLYGGNQHDIVKQLSSK